MRSALVGVRRLHLLATHGKYRQEITPEKRLVTKNNLRSLCFSVSILLLVCTTGRIVPGSNGVRSSAVHCNGKIGGYQCIHINWNYQVESNYP